MSAADAMYIAEVLDPVLVHLIVKFLRENYPASDPAANAVLERVVALTAAYPGLVSKCRQGEQDSISTWFEQEHGFAGFKGSGGGMIDLIVEKLES
jgi:hypothetical protein